MLRFGFLPSDFHPLLLLLGEADDMRRFARLLRRFAKDSREVRLETCDFCAAAAGTAIVLRTSGALPGMHQVQSTSNAFVWALEPWRAEMFAEMIEQLAEPCRKSGSVMLECGLVSETAVKVSLGEYTDDFLCA
jgi:hypothetical protein